MGAVGSQFNEAFGAGCNVSTIDQTYLSFCNEGKQRHILCYGDNLTFGFCSHGQQCKPYAAALSDALVRAGIKCKVSVGGLSGHTSKQMVSAVESPTVTDEQGEVIGRGLGRIIREDGPFDLCIIMAGTNDLTLLSRSEAIVNNLRNLHTASHRRGVPTIALAPPSPQRAGQAEMAKLLAEWVQTSQSVLAYVNTEDLVPRSTKDFWEPDRVHLSPAGSAALGQRLLAHLLPVISYLEWGEAATVALKEMALQQQRQNLNSTQGPAKDLAQPSYLQQRETVDSNPGAGAKSYLSQGPGRATVATMQGTGNMSYLSQGPGRAMVARAGA